MRSYAANFVLSLGAFVLLYVVFTFFELMGDIIRNQTPFIIVGEYLFNLIPYIVSAVTPLCSLLAVLITFGALNRTSELTAMKATGISLYRVVAPILVLAAILAAALFAFDESYLPGANRRQEQLRAEIKDKPAQTFLLAGRKWISGQTDKAGDPDTHLLLPGLRPGPRRLRQPHRLRIRSPDLHPPAPHLRQKRPLGSHRQQLDLRERMAAHLLRRSHRPGSYQAFPVATFPEIREQPGYFIKEDKPSDEMSYGELDHYIADLRQSGFDTIKLRVQLDNKLAVPAITLVMAILAVPFAVSMGKRGGLVGIATAIGVAIAYWVSPASSAPWATSATLPPLLAAWSPDLLFGIAGTYLLLRTPT